MVVLRKITNNTPFVLNLNKKSKIYIYIYKSSFLSVSLIRGEKTIAVQYFAKEGRLLYCEDQVVCCCCSQSVLAGAGAVSVSEFVCVSVCPVRFVFTGWQDREEL